MSRSHHCPHCRHHTVRTPPRWGVLAVALAWGFVVAMLFLASLIGPFIMFVVPVLFAVGASAVTSAHDFAFAPPECERCGKLVLEAPATELAPPHVAVLARAV